MDFSHLIKEATKGSSTAQKCLFEKYAPKMLLVCRRYVRSAEDAEELMLNGFCKFFKGLSTFDYRGEGSTLAWLKKILVNECLMFMRKQNLFVLVAESNATDVTIEEDFLDRLSAAEIFDLILQLPAGYRTVFNLYEIDGMTHSEIAAALNISEGTSKSQLSKGKALLKKWLLEKESNYARRNSK